VSKAFQASLKKKYSEKERRGEGGKIVTTFFFQLDNTQIRNKGKTFSSKFGKNNTKVQDGAEQCL